MRITASYATNACSGWIITAVDCHLMIAWVLGCVGYLNYRFFLLFAFWGGIWSSYIAIFTYFNMHLFNMTYYEYMFFVSLNMMTVFCWMVFFCYGALALKGLTIIEAGDRFHNRATSVYLYHKGRN